MSAGSSERNRIQKVLEDANIKLGSVLSDVFGLSGQKMLQQLVNTDTIDIANAIQLAHWKLKPKMEAIEQSLEGKLTDHHRFLVKASLEHMRFIEEQLKRLDEEIQRRLQPYQEEYALLQTIPGIKETGAARILGRDWNRHVGVSRRGPPLVMGRRVSWKQRKCGQKVSDQDP